MGEIILLAVGAIVWAIIKAISKPPQQSQSPHSPSSRTAQGGSVNSDLLSSVTPLASVKPQQPAKGQVAEEEIVLERESLLSKDEILRGFIMAEVLGPPLAKRPRRRQ